MGLCNKLCEKVLGHINDHYWAILGHINDINGQNFRLAYAPVHTNPFSFENAYFCMRFRRSSTLIRWKTDTLTHKNGGFRKCLPRWRLSKTDAFRISVDGRKRRFSKTLAS